MFKKVTFSFLCYFLSGFLVLISISTNISAGPRKPVFNSSNSNSSSGSDSQEPESVESRLSRLERLLESQSLVDLMIRLDNIQAELQNMRGDIEVINHSIDDIKKRQRDLYIDIDRRLVALERGGKSATSTPSSSGSQIIQSNVNKTAVALGIDSGTTTKSDGNEQKMYQQAFDLLSQLRYEKSIQTFNKVISSYPNGRYAHIAQYWVGEANYAQRNFKQAIKAYEKLISNYSKSPKVAEALLKIGYSYYEITDIKKAKSSLNKLIKLYPNTTEASQAKNKLRDIKKSSSKR